MWNQSPQPNETVTWSGGADGEGYATGKGIRQWYQAGKQGSRFEGNMYKGKKTGKGKLFLINGNRYEGDFVDDKRSGKGVYSWPSGSRYEGDWVEGKQTGKGVYTWPNGDRYEGDWVDGKRTGKGIFVWANGDRYEGDFVDGKRTGKGIYTWADKLRYEGDFVDDKRTGKGIVTWPNGDRYEGDWVDGKQQGYGIEILANGKRSAGNWENGKLIGTANTSPSANRAPTSGKRAPIPSGEYSPYIGGSGWIFTDKGYMVFDEMIAADHSVTWTGTVDSQGFASGEGILRWYNREGKLFTQYEGSLMKGKRNGRGIQKDGQSDGYDECTFVNDKCEGKGVSVWYKNGQRNSYEGDFTNGSWHGKGIRIWGNGDRYEGSFVKNKLTGYGILTLASGTVYEGEFIDGRRVLNQEEIAAKYPVGTKVEVVQWKRLFDSYGYAGIVRENDGSDVTLEVIAFINVNNDVEAAPASGGKRLVKGQDIGTLVTTSMRYITGYYKGDTQANSTSPMNLAGDYTIENQYDSSDNKMRIYSIKCSETGAWAEVLYFYNPQSYTWRTFDKKNRHWPEYNTSFHQVAVKACRGIVD